MPYPEVVAYREELRRAWDARRAELGLPPAMPCPRGCYESIAIYADGTGDCQRCGKRYYAAR